MKVYVSADLEGVNGVVHHQHVFIGEPGYERARAWMLKEVNAAIEGALEGGATDILVNDSHSQMINLLLDELHPAASLVSGNAKPLSMMQELDASFDAVFFVGYHAKAGTEGALFDHTFSSSTLHDVVVNERSLGEFGLNAALAGSLGVPAVLVTGDVAVVAEAKNLIEKIESVAVKQATNRRAARCYPFKKTLQDIGLMARRALQQLDEKTAFTIEPPLHMTVEFQKCEFADLAANIPGVARVSGYAVEYRSEEFSELYKMLMTMLRLCG